MSESLTIASQWAAVVFSADCLKYVLLLYVLAVLALPLSYALLNRTRVMWVASARLLGLLLLTYMLWLPSHTRWVTYSTTNLYLLLFLAIPFSIWGYRRVGVALWRRGCQHWRALLAGETLFLLTMAACIILRMHSAGIIGYEKFMDAAYLNACIYSTHMPPPDPWHFELPINYYYGGYLQLATLARLSGVVPEVAFNLSVSVVFAMTGLLSFALAFELLPKVRWALLGFAAVALMGNLDLLRQNWEYWKNLDANKSFAVDWWRPSRVIYDELPGQPPGATINEFPFFSFILADLHPHMMSLPFVLLFMGLLFNMLKQRKRPPPVSPPDMRVGWRRKLSGIERWLAMGWVLGALAWINGFDFITFAFALYLFLVFQTCVRTGPQRRLRAALVRPSALSIAIIIAAAALFSSFFINYESPIGHKGFPIGLVEVHSGPGEFLTVWGTHIFVIAAFIFALAARLKPRFFPESGLLVLGASAVCWMAFYLILKSAVSATLLLLLCAVVVGFYFSRKSVALTYVIFCICSALLIMLGCEWVHLRDSYGASLQRMNTLFKFHYPCWVLIGVCVPYCVHRIMHESGMRRALRWPLSAGALILFAWGLEYAMVVPHMQVSRYDTSIHGPANLDGLKFMARQHPGDYAALQWLRENTQPDDVILEAVGNPYGYYARMATHSPARAVLGWANHEALWRGDWPAAIEIDVRTMYKSTNMDEVIELVKRYGIDYIYIGSLELQDYPAKAPGRFEDIFPQAFSNPEHFVTLYRVANNAAED